MKQDLYLSVSVCRHLDIRAIDEIPREKYRPLFEIKNGRVRLKEYVKKIIYSGRYIGPYEKKIAAL